MEHEMRLRDVLAEAVSNADHADSCPGSVVPRVCHCWKARARPLIEERPAEYGFMSRGIGKDGGPCFVCGAGNRETLHANIAAFVRSREDGEAIVRMIGVGARLDYRPSEPDWIQVKITACPKHEHDLSRLQSKTIKPRHTITAEDVRIARRIGPGFEDVTDYPKGPPEEPRS